MIPAPVRELGSGPPFPEGGGPSAPTSGEPDWRSLFERERRRAEEWRRGEIDWRAKARFWRRQFEIGRDKLTAARAEVREVRRAAREALSLRAEVGRLKRLLAAAGVDARKRSTIVSLRLEVETRRTRIGELEAELAKLRASRAVHAKARFGRKSERRERAGSGRPRGQQAGAAGHGRTPTPHFSPGAVMIAEDFGSVRVLATESIAGTTVEGARARTARVYTGTKNPRGRGQRSPPSARPSTSRSN